ncbi:OLC1v1037005C1 [Oldenlandia corymbosa var. corymbosa]|uniref:OLC1v1037005C1 n=1 Tax=Oldenlandia corymbosa var. corymbosa TaxID=529605 RepID=A0AAV1CYQ4_OLDCO|nr:OLC1v1037005C1 [Oldenlandia corymbosa var. corymbosa]
MARQAKGKKIVAKPPVQVLRASVSSSGESSRGKSSQAMVKELELEVHTLEQANQYDAKNAGDMDMQLAYVGKRVKQIWVPKKPAHTESQPEKEKREQHDNLVPIRIEEQEDAPKREKQYNGNPVMDYRIWVGTDVQGEGGLGISPHE